MHVSPVAFCKTTEDVFSRSCRFDNCESRANIITKPVEICRSPTINRSCKDFLVLFDINFFRDPYLKSFQVFLISDAAASSYFLPILFFLFLLQNFPNGLFQITYACLQSLLLCLNLLVIRDLVHDLFLETSYLIRHLLQYAYIPALNRGHQTRQHEDLLFQLVKACRLIILMDTLKEGGFLLFLLGGVLWDSRHCKVEGWLEGLEAGLHWTQFHSIESLLVLLGEIDKRLCACCLKARRVSVP